MKPQEHEKFRANEVIKTVKALLDERLKGKKYDSNESAQLSKELCTEIKEKVKENQIQIPWLGMALNAFNGSIVNVRYS